MVARQINDVEPMSVKYALSALNEKDWKQVMNEKMESILAN